MAPKVRLRHKVEHTRNKHSRAVCKGETIIIRLAKNLSKTEEQEHIQNLLRRMTQMVLEERQKTSIDPFRHLLNGGQSQTVTLASGKRVTFSLTPGAKTRASRTARGWSITVSPQVRRKALHRLLWNLLSDIEIERLTNMVHQLNDELFGVRIREVKLGFATTQWGSCSTRGVIMLNTALLFTQPSVLKYVIVHELAHRIHADHSKRYWNEVERALPNYEKSYKALQNYRLPTL
jgi:predicted metal-dependent hydrolase